MITPKWLLFFRTVYIQSKIIGGPAMAGLQAFVALFGTVLWPFIKEWLMGMKDHPYNQERNRKGFFNQRAALVISIAICVHLALYAFTLHLSNQTLTKKLEKATLLVTTSKSKVMTDEQFIERASMKYDLMECNKRVESETERSSLLVQKLDILRVSKLKVERQLKEAGSSCKVELPKETTEEVQDIDETLDEVRARIERLKKT